MSGGDILTMYSPCGAWRRSPEDVHGIHQSSPSHHQIYSWMVKESVNLLDVTVTLEDGSPKTDLYVKPTDTHQYLSSNSCHPLQSSPSVWNKHPNWQNTSPAVATSHPLWRTRLITLGRSTARRPLHPVQGPDRTNVSHWLCHTTPVYPT